MGGSIVNGVETRVPSGSKLNIRLLGAVEIWRNDARVALPRSRKVRALLALLALTPGPQPRSRLCSLLWDVPNDPRGELRWCLSKLRGLLDEPERRRVVSSDGGLVELDLAGVTLDALVVESAARDGISTQSTASLHALCELFGGELLDGLSIDGNLEFGAWLITQRE